MRWTDRAEDGLIGGERRFRLDRLKSVQEVKHGCEPFGSGVLRLVPRAGNDVWLRPWGGDGTSAKLVAGLCALAPALAVSEHNLS